MGGFLSFVKKEALHILRDKRTMLIVLLLPIVQILLFGFAISTEMNNIDFAVVAPNRTETIRQQIERMEAMSAMDAQLSKPTSTPIQRIYFSGRDRRCFAERRCYRGGGFF